MTKSIDVWIKGEGPDSWPGLIGFYVASTFVSFLLGVVISILIYGANGPDDKVSPFMAWVLLTAQAILIPFCIFVHSRIKFLNNIRLGEKFSKLYPYTIQLFEKSNIHYLAWCGCSHRRDSFAKMECLHDKVKFPIDVTDFRAQSKVISKLEKIYSVATLQYERHKNNEKEMVARLSTYSEDVKNRLLEYNKLNKELSA
jgi:hypothetical protein